jgi:transposase
VSESYEGRQIVGMDLHRRRSVLVRMTETGEALETVRISNDAEYLRQVMARAGEAPDVVLEATYGWYWAADTLAELGAHVHLAHPLGVKMFSFRRVKNDQRDAADLADLLRMGRRRRRQIIRVGQLPGQRPCPRRTRIMTHRRAGHHSQRPDPFRRVHTQPLRDHAAQGSPRHLSGTQSITVQHSQAVASHVPDRVRMSIEVDTTGPTGVPMIEPDHLNSTLNKPTNQRIRATNTLSRRPHNHQNGGKPRIPDPLSPNPQRPGSHKSLVRIQHGGTAAATCCRTPTFTEDPAAVALAS